MPPTSRPAASDAAEYYFTYINKVPPGDIRQLLDAQTAEALSIFDQLGEQRADHRYAEGKWSAREVLSHINDCERLFVFRAFWFARGLEEALPSFDQDAAIAQAAAGSRPWSSHVKEFRAIRAASVAFFNSLPEEAWMRRGSASGYSFTVHAMAYITAGHVAHHLQLLREHYAA